MRPTQLIRGRFAYGCAFALVAALLILQAIRAEWLLFRCVCVWLSLDLSLIAAAYFRQNPRVFGKTSAGTLRRCEAALMMPFLAITSSVWRIQNLLSGEPVWNEVMPGVCVGRRCELRCLPPKTALVVDLTAEFPTPAAIRTSVKVVCIPTLDGCAPNLDACLRTFDMICATADSTVYVNCANGHGRSVAFVAAFLLIARVASTPDEAIDKLTEARPRASLNPEQRQFLEKAFENRHLVPIVRPSLR